MSAILGFTLLAILSGALGGWITGAVLHRNFFNKRLRPPVFSVTMGLAAGLGGYIWLGTVGALGLLATIPCFFIAWIWVRKIEPIARPYDSTLKATRDSDRDSEERFMQVTFALLGGACGGALGFFGSLCGGFFGALFVSTIDAAFGAMFIYGGVILLFILLIDTITVFGPLVWAGLNNFAIGFVDFLSYICHLVCAFLDWLTSIGDRIGARVSDDDQRLDRDEH